jgi:NAD(P)-dependent dehydrogenase (short-subunit alcohol dehydrogenase family)
MTNEGRVALITGGAQGLGAAAASRLLSDGFAGVVLLDRNGEGLAATAKRLAKLGACVTLTADLLDAATPAKAVALARQRFGRLDVLLNAAGSTDRCGLDDTTPADFDRMFGINVKAPLFMMQEAVKLMRERGQGTVINVGSMLSYGGPPNLITYSATKAALATLTKAAANAVKREGIRMFTINLGWVATEGEHALQTRFHGLPENWAEVMGRRMPSGRMITSDDVAGLVAFLVSPAAQMMTGAAIDYEQMPAGVYDSHPALAPE